MAEKAAEFKEKGNAAFAAKDWNLAIDFYTKAIQADATNHVFWSNRSACYINTGEYAKAKDDAKKCMVRDVQDWRSESVGNLSAFVF